MNMTLSPAVGVFRGNHRFKRFPFSVQYFCKRYQIGQVVGAVAVSGLPELEDIELAEIGVNAITG